MESFFSSLKTERTARKERFYNPRRRHSAIGYLSLMEFERNKASA
jgi:putative transposase